ncbi:MAG: cytochrome c oxidase subunit II [Desulfuromonas sp.]|nr:MAG: cytochrome c oxidase subunit II [Desulfuromonas sp.]
MNPQSLTTVEAVDPVFYFIFGVSAVMLVGIVVAMVWFAYRYNRKRCPVPESQKDQNVWLEVTWTVIPTIIVLMMFWFGWEGYLSLRRIPDNAMAVQGTARMWSWLFTYENGKTSDKLYVQVGTPVKVKLTSDDVLHSFFAPAFRVKRDCVPGMENYAWFVADEAGSYDVFCAEYCGVAHADMITTIEAVPPAEFDAWLAGSGEPDERHPGLVAMENYGCLGCHSLDGAKQVGPTFKGIAGRQTVVEVDGREKTISADRDYLLRAINQPNAEIVKGFPPAMPPFADSVSADELEQMVDYLMQDEQEGAEEVREAVVSAEHEKVVESEQPDSTVKEHAAETEDKEEKTGPVANDPEQLTMDGMKLLQENGCLGCHSTDGSRMVGPSFKGIVGRQVEVEKDGATTTLTSDRQYLYRAINEPAVEIVVGYPPVMPAAGLSEKEVEAMIDTLEEME